MIVAISLGMALIPITVPQMFNNASKDVKILLENLIHTYGMKKHRKKVRTSQLNKMTTH